MRTIDAWFSEYGESHQHPVNVAIHKVAVPLILWSVFGLAWALSMYLALTLAAFVTLFYFRLSRNLAVGMVLLVALELGVVYEISIHSQYSLWLISLTIFAVAWVFQFIGHAIEGKRPSFLKDLAFLLIGPAWVIAPLYRAAKVKL